MCGKLTRIDGLHNATAACWRQRSVTATAPRACPSADTLRLTVIQMWRRNHGDHADFLNFSLGILKPLKRPVSGILGPSYLRDAGPGGPRGKVAGAAASSTASGQPLLSATTV